MHALLLAAALALVSIACHDHDGHEHGDEECGLQSNCTETLSYSPGMEVSSESGNLGVRLIAVEPAPPAVAGTWTIEIIDSGGAVVTTAAVTSVNAWSIDCGHYGLEQGDGVVVTTNADDTFTFSPDFAHGGPWRAEITLDEMGVTDLVRVPFCLPE